MANEIYVIKTECDKRHRDLLQALKELGGSVGELNSRLYRDNGKKSVQTVLNDHERIMHTLCWIVSVAGGAAIVGIVGLILERVIR